MSNDTRLQPRQPRGVPTGGRWRATRRAEGPALASAGTPEGNQSVPAQHDQPDLPQITRSHGVPAGYGGYVVGGGYKGATKELDDCVQDAASALAKRFGSDVEIRFNSDRKSGGAWLVTHPGQSGITANTWIGVSARLGEGDRGVQMSVYIAGEALRDPLSVDADTRGRRTLRRDVTDLDGALALVAESSIAGDRAEMERRRSLAAAFGQREAELREAHEVLFAKRTRRRLLTSSEREQIVQAERLAYEHGHAELVEQFWSEVARAEDDNS